MDKFGRSIKKRHIQVSPWKSFHKCYFKISRLSTTRLWITRACSTGWDVIDLNYWFCFRMIEFLWKTPGFIEHLSTFEGGYPQKNPVYPQGGGENSAQAVLARVSIDGIFNRVQVGIQLLEARRKRGVIEPDRLAEDLEGMVGGGIHPQMAGRE